MLRIAVALAVLTACGGGTEDVTLALTAAATCDTPALESVSVLSVEVYGDSGGQLCILRQRCVFDLGMPQSVDDLATALREANPPLVDFEASDARAVGVIGHITSCWRTDDRIACGFNDLAQASDGALAIQLGCGSCDDTEIPFCP